MKQLRLWVTAVLMGLMPVLALGPGVAVYAAAGYGEVFALPKGQTGFDFHDGFARIVIDDKYGFIDTQGQIVIEPQYDYTEDFYEGMACVWRDRQYGFINTEGTVVIPFKYSGTSQKCAVRPVFRDGLAWVTKQMYNSDAIVYYGLIDREGHELTEFEYEFVREFQEGFSVVATPEKLSTPKQYGYIDTTGKVLGGKIWYTFANSFSEGLACIMIGGSSAWIDKTGKIVIDINEVGGDFHQGMATYGNEYKHGYIDKSGKLIVDMNYTPSTDANFTPDGLARVSVYSFNDKWQQNRVKYGYIDTTGREVIPLLYDEAGRFNDGAAWVKTANYRYNDGVHTIYDEVGGALDVPEPSNPEYKKNWGLIDKTGSVILPPSYDDAYIGKYGEGLTPVKLNGLWGFVDNEGREVVKPKYDDVMPFHNGLAVVKKNGAFGYVDRNGQEVTAIKYGLATDYEDGLARVWLDGTYRYIGLTDKVAEEEPAPVEKEKPVKVPPSAKDGADMQNLFPDEIDEIIATAKKNNRLIVLDNTSTPGISQGYFYLSVVKALGDAGISVLMKFSAGDVYLGADALKTMYKYDAGSVHLYVAPNGDAASHINLSGKQAANIRPNDLVVYPDIYSGTSTETLKLSVTVSVPYKLKNGEKASDIGVWYLDEDGSLTKVPSTYSGGKVHFVPLQHFHTLPHYHYRIGTAEAAS